ncbi:MAG: hypothetical protein K8S56_11005, partial [Candidatus Cloacimonetes bacterium]|nr:hypothetical protein [Candidatus Cloacimonadota bacterium]
MRVREVLFLLLIISCATLFANVQLPGPDRPTAQDPGTGHVKPITRFTPLFTFDTNPTLFLAGSMYDYMIGGYTDSPLKVQSGGGVYAAFHGDVSERMIYSAYVDAGGVVTPGALIAAGPYRQGFPGMDLDFDTSDAFFAYHVDNDGDGAYEVEMVWDIWHIMNAPGLFGLPLEILDNEVYGGVDTPFADDQFIWPKVYITEAPTYSQDAKRRIFVVGNNFIDHTGGTPAENILLIWSDFSTSTAGDPVFDGWSYHTFPLLDGFNSGTPGTNCGRYHHSTAVTRDGKIAFIGLLQDDT